MFSAETYAQRRYRLTEEFENGLILLVGHEASPINTPHNQYPFRQDSSFLYYLGLNQPGLAAIFDIDARTTTLYGKDITTEELVWTGPIPTLAKTAAQVGVTDTAPVDQLEQALKQAQDQGRTIHLLPTYQPGALLRLQQLFKGQILDPSPQLIRTVVAQRSCKTEDEIAQIEIAIDISHQMHVHAMRACRAGRLEKVIAAEVESIGRLSGLRPSFATIFSVHGEILHNPTHANLMQDGDIIVHDSGVESDLHYASDITRTIPVNGSFTQQQRDLYSIVLNTQLSAIEAIKPGTLFRDVHRLACRSLLEGLQDLGLINGDLDEAHKAGAHTLFFPHGLGHMLGMDVHDMESLGEDYVGYTEDLERDSDYGCSKLRFARALEAGFVVTVEPGLYFIPQLIEQWQAENKLAEFINYNKLESFRDARGIRIEDDVLVTSTGNRVLGQPIPKTIEAVEAACQEQ